MSNRIYLNPLPKIEDATWIELSQRYYALIDTWLALIVPKFHVLFIKNCKSPYARHNWQVDKKFYSISLHRWVLEQNGIDAIDEIDHINRNGLDNRLCNLRAASGSQNQWNQALKNNNKSGYKGVSWYKKYNKWRSQISINNKCKHIGYFDDIIEAARAYDRTAIINFGIDYAYLNFPEDHEEKETNA